MAKDPSFYAIIPATVRYDDDLVPNSKLLYGEISALSNKRGFCYASNDYFSKLYNVAPETISRWISQLCEKGYLFLEIDQSNLTQKRKIFLGELLTKRSSPLDKKIKSSKQKDQEPLDEKIKHNNTFNNTENNTLSSDTQELFKKWDDWVTIILDGSDPVFQMMLYNSKIDQEFITLDLKNRYMALLAEYPKKQPADQQKLRISFLGFLTEQKSKLNGWKKTTDTIQDTNRRFEKMFGKERPV